MRKDMREEFSKVWDEIKSLREETTLLRKDMREEFDRVWDEIKSLRRDGPDAKGHARGVQ